MGLQSGLRMDGVYGRNKGINNDSEAEGTRYKRTKEDSRTRCFSAPDKGVAIWGDLKQVTLCASVSSLMKWGKYYLLYLAN